MLWLEFHDIIKLYTQFVEYCTIDILTCTFFKNFYFRNLKSGYPMRIYIGEKIKQLRKEKKILQKKFM